ncbi:MAG: DUF2254 domain-containing protein [Rudanella sp.]|nr:DUF2254 domain-containing protein [Rudanella sp.]
MVQRASDYPANQWFAVANSITVRVEAGVGDFVTQQNPVVSLVGCSQPIDSSTRKEIIRAFSIRRTRTVDGETAFGIRQLVDIALKALSPASEDITTAVLVLDDMSAVLVRLVQHHH